MPAWGSSSTTTPARQRAGRDLTQEFSNSSGPTAASIQTKGNFQLLFLLKGNPCDTTYSDRQGKISKTSPSG